MGSESREHALESALFALSERWRYDIGPDCWIAVKFRQMINPKCKIYKGGVGTVRHLLYQTKKTTGLNRLAAHPELTVEQLVLNGKWDDLFDDEDRSRAREKLQQNRK
jgi:hypothetical protein